jgi:endogenous inhibitor of DNA gyrase (YacG/DUF329 family)
MRESHEHICPYCGEPVRCPDWAHEETDEFGCERCLSISEQRWAEEQFGGQRQ